MDKIIYECECCKTRMSAKNRPGSNQFGDMDLQILEHFTYGKVEDDSGRPEFTKNYGDPIPSFNGWRCSEEEANFFITHSRGGFDSELKRMSRPDPAFVRTENAKDLVIRISIREKTRNSDEEGTPRQALESMFKVLEYLKEKDKYEMGLCWLSGGHTWKKVGVIPNG